jgi:hypothetical protein
MDRYRLWILVLLHLVEAVELLTTACVRVCRPFYQRHASQKQIRNCSQLSRTSHSSAKRCEVKAAKQPVGKVSREVQVFHDMNSDPWQLQLPHLVVAGNPARCLHRSSSPAKRANPHCGGFLQLETSVSQPDLDLPGGRLPLPGGRAP